MGSCEAAGVAWDFLGDFGEAPFVLDRDELDRDASLLTPADEDLTSLGEVVLSATWTWGAARPLGRLTEHGAGTAILAIIDTERLFDPLNADSPYARYLRPGVVFAITADGQPVWTGTLRTWAHEIGTAESTLQAIDPIGQAGSIALRRLDIDAGPTAAQAAQVAAAAGVPLEIVGGSSYDRLAVEFEGGTLAEALAPIRLAELAELTATRAGGLRWRGSAELYAPAPSIVINCGGVFLEDLSSTFDLDRIRNRVRITDHDPELYEDASSFRRHGAREVASTVAALAFDET